MAKQYLDNMKKAKQKTQQPKVNTTPLVTRLTPGKTPIGVASGTATKKPIGTSVGNAVAKRIGKAGISSDYAAKKTIAKQRLTKGGTAKKLTGGGLATTPGFKPGTKPLTQKKY